MKNFLEYSTYTNDLDNQIECGTLTKFEHILIDVISPLSIIAHNKI